MLDAERPRIINYLRHRWHLSPDEADDVAQDAIIRAWTYRDHYNPCLKLNPWLWSIVIRTACDRSKVQRKHRSLQLSDDLPVTTPEPDTVLSMIAAEQMMQYAGMIDAIREPFRSTARMVWIEGVDCERAARMQRVQLTTIRVRLWRAARLVREMSEAA